MKDKVVIITGSSMGIGKTTAMRFASLGASVVINGRDESRLEKVKAEFAAKGYNVLTVTGNVSEKADREKLIGKTLEAFGKIDVLINNASLFINAAFRDQQPGLFEKIVNTNLLGTVGLTQDVLPYLEKTSGSVIFISSVAGFYGLPGASAYCASKAALHTVVQSMRIEMAKSNVHVGLVCPGFTVSDEEKRVLDKNGNPKPLPWRPAWMLQSQEKVAATIVRTVRRRSKGKVLTVIGKLNAFCARFAPGVIRRALVFSQSRMKDMY